MTLRLRYLQSLMLNGVKIICNMKKELNIKITLTREEAEELSGIDIPLQEWDAFWQCFKDYYLLEYKGTLSFIGDDWESLKDEYLNKSK